MYMQIAWPVSQKALLGPLKSSLSVRHDPDKDRIMCKGNQAVVPLVLLYPAYMMDTWGL